MAGAWRGGREPMQANPLEVAIRELTDTQRLLEAVITSAESFDYIRAKGTVEELRLKVKVLGRMQAELRAAATPPECIIPFPANCVRF